MKSAFTLFKRKTAKGVVWYYLAYDDAGERRRYSTGQTSKTAARTYCEALSKMGKLIPDAKDRDVTLAEFSAPFWVWGVCPIVTDKIARGGHYSQTLCKNNRKSMVKNVLPMLGKTKLSKLTPAMINTWLLNLQNPREIKGKMKPGLSNSTANKMLRLLKEMLDTAEAQGLIEKNPCLKVKRLTEHPQRRDSFSLAEAILILERTAWGNDMAWLASYLAASTGMREGEIRSLTKASITPDKITVSHSYDRTIGVKGTKSDKDRDIPITGDLYTQIMRFAPISDTGFIFSLTGGVSPVSPDFILNALYTRIYAIGITEEMRRKRNLTFHSWRHFFNTRLIASGVQGEITRAVIGHESEEMTERYLHLRTGDMEAVMAVQDEIRKIVG